MDYLYDSLYARHGPGQVVLPAKPYIIDSWRNVERGFRWKYTR